MSPDEFISSLGGVRKSVQLVLSDSFERKKPVPFLSRKHVRLLLIIARRHSAGVLRKIAEIRVGLPDRAFNRRKYWVTAECVRVPFMKQVDVVSVGITQVLSVPTRVIAGVGVSSIGQFMHAKKLLRVI